jgi:uncharacterized protein YneF (UPF0154 family)
MGSNELYILFLVLFTQVGSIINFWLVNKRMEDLEKMIKA